MRNTERWRLRVLDMLSGGGSGGGGENPNYVQTVTGTLRNPWGNVGDIDIKELSTAITPSIKEATAYIDIDATALNFGHIYSILTNYSLQKIAAQGGGYSKHS